MAADSPDAAADAAIDDQLVDALAQLSFAVQATLGDAASAHALSLTQLRLLGVLTDRVVAMADLARHLRLDRSSATGLVDRAVARGLLAREPRPGDGRGVQVRLTPDGQELAAEVRRQVASRLSELVAPLSASARTRLAALALQVVEATQPGAHPGAQPERRPPGAPRGPRTPPGTSTMEP